MTGSSGSLLRSRAREVAEAGADLLLSLLSTDPIAAPLTEIAAKSSVPAAGLFCCPAVEEGSPGPAVIAASQSAQQKQPRSSLVAEPNPGSRAGREHSRASEIAFRLLPGLRSGGGNHTVYAAMSRGPERIET